MDDTTLILMFVATALVLLACLAVFGAHRKRTGSDQRVGIPLSRHGAAGLRREAVPTAPRGLRPEASDKMDIDRCLDRIFTKQAVGEAYAGVLVDDMPKVVLHILDEIIEQNAYIKHAHSVMGKIDSLENSMEELVDLVATDPLLTATVMRQANSAHFGASGEVTSLKFAIELMGLSSLKNLVYREYVLREHRGKAVPDPELLSCVWQHATLTATAAAYLAQAFPGADQALAYTVGLLHDIGKFLLLSSGQVEMAGDRCLRPYLGGFMKDTAGIWRHDHALAGKIAALKWQFGPEVAGAIGMHHYPELTNLHKVRIDPGMAQTLVLTHVANQVAKHFSREPRQAVFIAPLHFSYHNLADRGAIRAVLSGSTLLSELAKIKASMALEEGL